MKDRRTFLALASALVPASLSTLAAQAPSSDTAPPRVSSELARHTLTGPLDAFDVRLIELRPGPAGSREHRHSGPVLGYVLEGRVRFGVNHEPERILGVGETFFEETGALHSAFGFRRRDAGARAGLHGGPEGDQRRGLTSCANAGSRSRSWPRRRPYLPPSRVPCFRPRVAGTTGLPATSCRL